MTDLSEVFAWNPTLRRPACVLLCAVLGANGDYAREFDDWLVGGELMPDGSSAIDGIRLYRATPEQVRQLAEQVRSERAVA